MFTREMKGWPKVAWKRKEGPLVVGGCFLHALAGAGTQARLGEWEGPEVTEIVFPTL